jgi:hypothetical protein
MVTKCLDQRGLPDLKFQLTHEDRDEILRVEVETIRAFFHPENSMPVPKRYDVPSSKNAFLRIGTWNISKTLNSYYTWLTFLKRIIINIYMLFGVSI